MACVAKPPVLLWLFLVAPLRAERPSLGFGILSTDHNDEALATKYKWNPNGHIDLDSDFRDLGGYSRDPKRSYDPCADDHKTAKKVLLAFRFEEDDLQGQHCDWPGIICEGNCVVGFELGSKDVREDYQMAELPVDWSQFRDLKAVQISVPHVFADITVFAGCWKLVSLEVTGSPDVTGDIRSLQHLEYLEVLRLPGANVMGDISVVESLLNLEALDLSDTQVVGDIQGFQASVELKELRLSGTQVVGNIRAFEATGNLMVLDLSTTQVSGDVSAFQNMTDLALLDLSLTKVSGDIRVFNTTSRLSNLQLMSTQVCGDIEVFRGTESLRFLYLLGTTVQGDIQFVTSTKNLKEVALDSTRVFGDIAVFNSTRFPHMSHLYLENTNVSGNIWSLEMLDGLLEISLPSTRVEGDILVFKHNRLLRFIKCHSPEIEGDVQVFQDHIFLEQLDLSFTKVTGDVTVFAGKGDLFKLKLASAQVAGDIGVLVSVQIRNEFQVHNVFQVLDLSSTQVTGNIWVFQHASSLTKLYLADTQVTGSLDGILHWNGDIQVVDLSRTLVTGRLTRRWRGSCRHLRSLKLSGSRVHFLPAGDDRIDLMNLQDSDPLLPALTTLEVSNCDLSAPASDLFRLLSTCDHVGSILAANSNLTGELPNLDPLPPTMLGKFSRAIAFTSALATSLEVLDLSKNDLSFVAAIPAAIRKIDLVSNQHPLQFAEGVLTRATRTQVFIDLRGNNLDQSAMKELNALLADGTLKKTAERTFTERTVAGSERGYSCYDLDQTNIKFQITPSKVLPDQWCTCLEGWSGTGINCTKCPENTYSDKTGLESCSKCPANTTGPSGAKSVHDCECQSGTLRQVEEVWFCGCPSGHARLQDSCVPCHERNLNCSSSVTTAHSARPLRGFARLEPNATKAYECLAKDRCPAQSASGLGCARGYDGPLCMGCGTTYFAASGSCKKCTGGGVPPWLVKVCLCLTLAASMLVGALAIAYCVYSWDPGQWAGRLADAIFAPGALGNLQRKLLRSEAPVLLQMVQLWVVLAVLASNSNETQDDQASNSRFWELPYLQHVEFAFGSFRELLYLQCYFGGRKVRLALALVSPVVPLLLLLCCLGLEIIKPGSGVNAALKVLTVFFIGGASKCFALRSCQLFDGGGRRLETSAFLRQLPDLYCDQEVPWAKASPEHKLVWAVFWPCAVCYGILVPCFLLYLYMRQHVFLRYCRAPLEISPGTKNEKHLEVGLEEKMQKRRVVAAAVAYVAMLPEGEVELQLREGKGIVMILDNMDQSDGAVQLEADAANSQFQTESAKLRHHAIAEMLLEHSVLEELDEANRILLGAKETLFKYATCRELWMEVVQKLVAVALVKVVSAAQVASNLDKQDLYTSLAKVIAITLALAGTVWMVRPYAQPQVSDLQICCFLSLSISAVGFVFQMAWLSRVALVMPLLLAAGHALQPDSPESLAWRLWEDLMEVPKDKNLPADFKEKAAQRKQDGLPTKEGESFVVNLGRPHLIPVRFRPKGED